MDRNLDWTEIWDQNIIAKKASFLADDILKRIFDEKLKLYRKLNLSLFELSFLYRWPLHVVVNTFIERLLRVYAGEINDQGNCYPLSKFWKQH